MRGPNPSYPIDLTDAEAKGFEQLIRAYNTPQALVMRAAHYPSQTAFES
jgi:hypothetical protein